MGETGRDRQGGSVTPSDGPQKGAPPHDSKTAGTDRDADRSGESQNEGHGHPRESSDRDRS
jgi:hypothetical protein